MNTNSDARTDLLEDLDAGARVEVAGASVIGADHRRAGRPCQDAFAVRRAGESAVLVACDGCGSGASSELGARLGANVLATALAAELGAAGDVIEDEGAWRRAAAAACDAVLAEIARLAPAFGAPRDALASHFLFTILAAAVTPRGIGLVAIGDGVIVVDGEVRAIAEEAPPYLAYALVGRDVPREVTWRPGARAVVLATDGAAALLGRAGEPLPGGGAVVDLARLADDDRVFTHPDALRRRLAIAGQETIELDRERGRVLRRGGLLADDTTVVAARRRRT